jgi:hypothetical protein
MNEEVDRGDLVRRVFSELPEQGVSVANERSIVADAAFGRWLRVSLT